MSPLLELIATLGDGLQPGSEVANLIGFYSSYGDDFNRRRIGVGSEILISDMYQKLYHLSTFEKEMHRIAVTLRGFADHLELQPPILEPEKTKPTEETK